MKKTILILALSILFISIVAITVVSAGIRSGYILLQVEENGEAWYVYPGNGYRYYLGRPVDAFNIMKKLALGAKHAFLTETDIFPVRLSGMILLDVDQNGEAYYIYPKDNKKYYLGRPADAFQIMNQLGQGIANYGLINIPIGDITGNITPTSTSEKILQNVPFTPQAPFGGWSDLRQEDGCEEASALMAARWAQGQTLTYEEALDQILKSSDYILDKYGEYRDISSADTLDWLIKDYFGYQNAILKNNITMNDIIDELKKGNVIIAPMNGQALGNPYFVQPGPNHHMLVIRGYDPARNIFITNDPGTKRGALYEYRTDILYNAIRDYTTGFHQPDVSVEKNMIVVSK